MSILSFYVLRPNLQVFQQFANTHAQTCPSGYTLQYMEHSLTGYNNSVAHGLPYTYSFTWTPPATNVGNVTIYVAGNAGAGNPPTADNDHIYSTKYTLTPAASGPAPAISSGGVVNAGEFRQLPASYRRIVDRNLRLQFGHDHGHVANAQFSAAKLSHHARRCERQHCNANRRSSIISAPTQINAQVPNGCRARPGASDQSQTRMVLARRHAHANALQPDLLRPHPSRGRHQYAVACHSGWQLRAANHCPFSVDYYNVLPSPANHHC